MRILFCSIAIVSFVLLVFSTKMVCYLPFGDGWGCFVFLAVSTRIALLLSGVRLKLLWFNDLTKLLPGGQACLPPNKITPRKPTRDQHAHSCFQEDSSKLCLWRQLDYAWNSSDCQSSSNCYHHRFDVRYVLIHLKRFRFTRFNHYPNSRKKLPRGL